MAVISKLLALAVACSTATAFMPVSRMGGASRAGVLRMSEADTAGESLIPIEMTGGDVSEEGEVDVDLDALSAEAAATTFTPKTDISDLVAAAGKEQDRRAPRQAKWLPMLLAPAALDGSMAGDVGFDPLGFASDKAALVKIRDAGKFSHITRRW